MAQLSTLQINNTTIDVMLSYFIRTALTGSSLWLAQFACKA